MAAIFRMDATNALSLDVRVDHLAQAAREAGQRKTTHQAHPPP
jgi:hypothetical protein